jgi:uncharacterized DUF497 family protein
MVFGFLNVNYAGFDWDTANRLKIELRLPTVVVENLFCQPLLIKPDKKHSFIEERFVAMGYSPGIHKLLVVIYTFRVGGPGLLIRPISARYASKKEKLAYEQQVKTFEENT